MLTDREKSLIYDSYFRIEKLIEDELEDYAEVLSLNTGHFWAVRKRGEKIILGHKYPGQASFHKQAECCSIRQAVKLIREHDMYMMRATSVPIIIGR